MLPFLKKNQDSVAGLIIKNRTPDKDNNSEDLEKEYSAEDCAQDLINAVHSHDKSAVITAIKEIMEKLKEGPKESASPHTYEAQNIAAAKEE